MEGKAELYDYEADFKNLSSVERQGILRTAKCLMELQKKALASVQEVPVSPDKMKRDTEKTAP
jgi:hypothetical protein